MVWDDGDITIYLVQKGFTFNGATQRTAFRAFCFTGYLPNSREKNPRLRTFVRFSTWKPFFMRCSQSSEKGAGVTIVP